MKPQILRKSLFVILFLLSFVVWQIISGTNIQMAEFGRNLFSILAYSITLIWMMHSYKDIRDKQRYFWLFFAMGISFLSLSIIISFSQQPQFGRESDSQVEDYIRAAGYLFFFTGFVYQIKVIKNTLPMLRFLLNIIIVIIAVYSVSWQFIMKPILTGINNMTHAGFMMSSIYHVLNISLLFAAICLIFIYKDNKYKTSLYLITAGFFVQVVGDFFHINHVSAGRWIFISWPISALTMGLGAVFAKEHPWENSEDEKLEYKNYFLTILSAGTLLVLTFANQENNVLEKGLQITVILLLVQQTITALENKNMFKKLKHLAYADGNYKSGKKSGDMQNNEMAKLLRRIENLAHYDSLTELPNRHLFQKRIEQELKSAEQNGTPLSLMYIDMDRFKYVNDSLGHDSGDLLLKEVAVRIKEEINEQATVARIGGDEFAIILLENDQTQLEQISSRILQKFKTAFNIHQHEIYTSLSIGIAIFPEGGCTAQDLLKSADAAMYAAKEDGRNRFAFFNSQLNEMISKKILVESKMRKGLEEGQFAVYYQPQVDLRTGYIIGLEALVRWNDPQLGIISPVDFIPIAEESGLIEPLGLWVLKTACQQMKDWQQIGLSNVSMSVNVSIRQFQNENFVNEVRRVLKETKLNPQFLKLEITESILQNINKTLGTLNELRALGIQIAIDDFGTGYSSLSYLKNLPVSCLKIDKAFIDEISVNENASIVKTIIDMGRNMNFTVIAEGVESSEHVSFLRKNQCFVGQGYLFSKPLPATDLEHLLEEKMMKIS